MGHALFSAPSSKQKLCISIYQKYICGMQLADTMLQPKVPASEIQIQAECFQWAWNNYPQTRRCFFHVPNGGSRNVIEAMQLKASGVVPGIPDTLFVWGGRIYAFEFKTATGQVSTQQKAVHEAWDKQGVDVKIVRSVETFKDQFLGILA